MTDFLSAFAPPDLVLGPFADWPQSLRIAYQMISASRFPMFVAWGDDHLYLYNAASIPIVGHRHPHGFGRPFANVWPEAWAELSPLLAATLAGATIHHRRLPITLLRDSRLTTTWWTFSYSPLRDEAGRVCGVFSVGVEDTRTVIAEQQQALRLALDTALHDVTDPDAVLAAASDVICVHLAVDRCLIRDVAQAQAANPPGGADITPDQWQALLRGEAVHVAAAPARLIVPRVRAGHEMTLVDVSTATERHWTADDIAVLREVAERIHSASRRVSAVAEVRRTATELRQLADALPVLIAYIDTDGRYRFGNRAHTRWFGVNADALAGRPLADVVGTAAHARLQDMIATARSGTAGVSEVRLPMPDGHDRHVQITYAPRLDGTGSVTGHYLLVQDIEDQKQAEFALRQSERRLNAVLESVSDGFFALDKDWRFSVFNRASEVAFGVSRADMLGHVIWDALPATRGTDLETRLRGVAITAVPEQFEADTALTPGITVEMRAAPKDGGGVAVAFSDISERKRAEELRLLLVNELNHRVKNMLTVVQAIAAQSLKAGSTVEEAKLAFTGRLTALAAAHTLLTAQNWESALLPAVVEAAINTCADRARFVVQGPAISLLPQTAVSFALALHELCTNAIKYGALSEPYGGVAINWEVGAAADGEPRLRFLWAEHGGPAVRVPTRRGFGSRLLERGLAREMRGEVTLDFAPSGLQCRIDVPLPQES